MSRFLAVMSVAGVSSIGAGNRRRCCQQQCSYQWQRRCQWQRTSASHFMATMSPSVLGRSRLVTCATRRPAGLCRDRQVLECARALRGQVRQAPRLSRSLSEAGRWACVASCRRRQVGQEAPPTARRWNPRTQRVTPAQQASGSDRPGRSPWRSARSVRGRRSRSLLDAFGRDRLQWVQPSGRARRGGACPSATVR